MNFEFMTIDTPLPLCMPFPRALTGFPVSSTAKVMYCRMLDAMLSKGQEDENGILFVCFPVTAIAAVLSRSPMTVKRSLNELETVGLTMWKNDRFFEERKVTFTPKIAAALLQSGKVNVKKLYSPKTGKTYDGTIVLADTGGKYVNYRIELSKKK